MNRTVARIVILALSLVATSVAAQRQGSSPNQPLIGLIDRYLANPFDTETGTAVMDSGDVRHDVTMVISTPVMPWRCYADSAEAVRGLDALMDMAYVAGNMRAQLVDRRDGDRPMEGMLGVLRVYPLIRARFPEYFVPEVDRWQRIPRDRLHALADSLASAPDGCPSVLKRYPGKSDAAPSMVAPPTPATEPPVYVAPTAPRDAPVGTRGDSALARLTALLEPCRRKALAAWPDARRRFLAGLPPRQTLFVTTRLRDAAGRVEQVFVAVDGIDGAQVTGRLWSDIGVVAGYQHGQKLTVPESEIVDWMISRPDGSEEGNWMGKFFDAYQATGRPPTGICDP